MDEGNIHTRKRNVRRYGLSAIILLASAAVVFLALTWYSRDKMPPAQEIDIKQMPPPKDEVEPWLRLDNVAPDANQVETGAEVYRLVCSACHGDRGQGLTPEWIATWNPEDQNCWQSKCHASNHPDDGFALPRYVPAITGEHMTSRFSTAMDLFVFIRTLMPWHAPGSLPDEEYWQVTAYVIFLNGNDLGDLVLDESNAGTVTLHGVD